MVPALVNKQAVTWVSFFGTKVGNCRILTRSIKFKYTSSIFRFEAIDDPWSTLNMWINSVIKKYF